MFRLISILFFIANSCLLALEITMNMHRNKPISSELFNYHVFLYVQLFIFLYFISINIFKKQTFKKLKKNIKYLIFIIQIGMFYELGNHFLDIDTCLDVGVCHEGLDINTEEGYWIINKENCLKYHYEWNDKYKVCTLRHNFSNQ